MRKDSPNQAYPTVLGIKLSPRIVCALGESAPPPPPPPTSDLRPLPSAMPVRATPGFSKFANAHPALTSDLWTLPLAESMASSVLSLPIGPHLTDARAQSVITAVRSFER